MLLPYISYPTSSNESNLSGYVGEADFTSANAVRISFTLRPDVYERPSVWLHAYGTCHAIDNGLGYGY